MHILIGLAMGVALLYFWLVGHWFARVLVHLVLMPLLAFLLAALFTVGIDQPRDPLGLISGAVLGLTIGWIVASLPVYCRRLKARQDAYRYELRKQELLAPGPVSSHQPLIGVERVPRLLR